MKLPKSKVERRILFLIDGVSPSMDAAGYLQIKVWRTDRLNSISSPSKPIVGYLWLVLPSCQKPLLNPVSGSNLSV
jgi:hypothetical protein